MSAAYANKFQIQVGDVVRLMFQDERAPTAEGLSLSLAAEVVMTRENFRDLARIAGRIAEEMK